MLMSEPTIAQLTESASNAANLLKALSNERRLLILCHLTVENELAVGTLVDSIGISQSALSQHLARLRKDGLVDFRRESQTLFYRIVNPNVGRVVALLRDIYCPDLDVEQLTENSK